MSVITGFCPDDYLKHNKYVAPIGIEGKRGCDLNCSYCLYPALGGQRMRLRDPRAIVDEMEYFHKEFQVNQFHFTDSVVNRPPDHFEAFLKEMIERDLTVGWTGFFREDTFTEKLAFLSKKAGISACYFSADALTEEGLSLLNKKLKVDDIVKAADITVKNDILTMHHFLVNLPFETRKQVLTSKETLTKILDIHAPAGNLGAVIFNNVRLYPGTFLTKKLIRAKLLQPETDLLYPVYYNPPETAHYRFELENVCHTAGVFSRFNHFNPL